MDTLPPFVTEESAPVIKGGALRPTQFSHMPRWLSHALGKKQEKLLGDKTLIHIRHGKTFSNAANRIAGGELAKNPREKDDYQILLDIILRLIEIHKQTGEHGPYIDSEGETQANNLGMSFKSAWSKNSQDMPTQIIVSPFRRTRQTLIRSIGRLLDYENVDDILDMSGDDQLVVPWKGYEGETTIQVNNNTAEIDGYLSLPLPSKMREIFLHEREKFIPWVKQLSLDGESPEGTTWDEILERIEGDIVYESLGEAKARGSAFLDTMTTSPHAHIMAFNHCDFIRQQVSYVLGENGKDSARAAEQLEHIVSPKNCSLTALAYLGNQWHLSGHNIRTNTL